MYVRVTGVRFDPTVTTDLTFAFQRLARAYQKLPGFLHCYNALDREAGRVVSVSFWATAAHARLDREALGEALTVAGVAGVRLDPDDHPGAYEVAAEAGPGHDPNAVLGGTFPAWLAARPAGGRYPVGSGIGRRLGELALAGSPSD